MPVEISREEFEKITEEAIASIPKKFLSKLENVEIVIEDYPSQYQIDKLLGSRRKNGFYKKNKFLILGLYEGVPQTKRYHYGGVVPDKITIFKKPIEKKASSLQDLREIVKNTVWHEIAHHFGMSEEEVKRSEIQRKKRVEN
ncbi:metallopeptidase family protein [bacterium]|nr:metallopeptidase family protein [bacterium]